MSDKEFYDNLMEELKEIETIKESDLEPANVMTIKPRFKVESSDFPIQKGGGYIASIRYDLGLS